MIECDAWKTVMTVIILIVALFIDGRCDDEY